MMPGLDGLRPERNRLNGRRFSAIVWADENGRMIELDSLCISKSLEILDFQVVQQSHGASLGCPSGISVV